MIKTELSPAELADIIASLGGPFRTEPFTGQQRLALRQKLENMMKDESRRLLWECYRSGQISERQWQEHLRDDPGLAGAG